jgi:hypothetical protein
MVQKNLVGTNTQAYFFLPSELGLWNKSSSLAAALGLTKFIAMTVIVCNPQVKQRCYFNQFIAINVNSISNQPSI